ncbi:MAG: LuxR family transcriptional regulator, partial [Anaerolineae bacterium]|nr:LuxR family transcriptional regulator [Anaerolineae bacterium]
MRTKLHIPSPRPDWVPRPRLIERLNQGLALGRPLTLVCAPAGYGKTTLVAQWLQTVDRPVAWLSLDENDNDIGLLLSYLIVALQGVHAGLGRAVQMALESSGSPAVAPLM